MALFVLTYGYNDTPERTERRDEHLAHLNKLIEQDNLVAAGPYSDRTGGVIILRADDEPAAQALIDQDPYTRFGVTKDRDLREWLVTVGPLASG
jgi:uncharacterized protein YciI